MDRIYRRVTQTNNGSKKKDKNRKRNVIMNFRVAQSEKELIDNRIRLSGLSRSEFFIQSCLYQKILVKGNIRTFDTMKETLADIYEKVNKLEFLDEMLVEDVELLRTIVEIMNHLYGRKDRKEGTIGNRRT